MAALLITSSIIVTPIEIATIISRSLEKTELHKFNKKRFCLEKCTIQCSTAEFFVIIVPEVPPLHLQAESWWTTHTIPVKWSPIPNHLRNGILTGYKIRFQAIEMGLVHYEEKPKEVLIPAENISTVLTGLENFALYRIEMTGFTIKGDGPSKVIFAGDLRWSSCYK